MIQLKNVVLDFPSSTKKLKKSLLIPGSLQSTGGIINYDAKGRASVRALDDVSLSFSAGDRVALVGHNGAGKTTLLRVMAGLYPPTLGRVSVEGRVAPLLNLSFGLDGDASGLENVWFRGLYLGMSRSEIASKLEDIVAFSELGDFINLPLRTYSSGMRARLAFAISTHVDSDVLLLDEVVATGDANFFQKASQKLQGSISQSKIMVLASHSNRVLRDLCNKAVFLEHGKVVATGHIDDVLTEYKQSLRKSVYQEPVQLAKGTLLQDKAEAKVKAEAEKRKKVLMINDTGGLVNPGCRAIKKAYKLIFKHHLPDCVLSGSIPVNYWMESFRPFAVPGRQSIQKKDGVFPAASVGVGDIDMELWDKTRKKLSTDDVHYQSLLEESDSVIVNAEGSVHHNSVRALAVLALTKTAVETGKNVVFMNATIQAVSKELVVSALSGASLIHVRESQSKQLLESWGLNCISSPDLAFMALDEISQPPYRLLDASDYVLVTAGVTVGNQSLKVLFDSVRQLGKKPVYFSIGDGGETELSERVCKEQHVPIVHACQLGMKETIGFLKQFPMAISGRHHINIMLMRAGTPFVALASNTWKIQETLNMVSLPVDTVSDAQGLLTAFAEVGKNVQILNEQNEIAFQYGRRLVLDFVRELKKWI